MLYKEMRVSLLEINLKDGAILGHAEIRQCSHYFYSEISPDTEHAIADKV
jgi:hypothetical protein